MNPRDVKISASLMCANLIALEHDLRALEEVQIDYLHLDLMDGRFVPNLGLGLDFIKQLRSATTIPFDVHLMVESPGNLLPKVLEEIKPAIVSFHVETTSHSVRLAQMIRAHGAAAGIALNPGTSLSVIDSLIPEVDLVLVMTVNPGFSGQKMVPSTLKKIEALRQYRDSAALDTLIAVDGNVSFEHGPAMRAAGADIFVCGSSGLFRSDMSIQQAARTFRKRVEAVDLSSR